MQNLIYGISKNIKSERKKRWENNVRIKENYQSNKEKVAYARGQFYFATVFRFENFTDENALIRRGSINIVSILSFENTSLGSISS